MYADIDVPTVDKNGEKIVISVTYEEIGQCPLCHVALHPDILGDMEFNNNLYMIVSCPSCEGIFFAIYTKHYGKYELSDLMPKNYVSSDIPKAIKALSPKFTEIFSQSEAAESQGLSEICGLGYRRSLEFLVKDYLCSLNADHIDEIRKQPLSQCIKDRIQDQRIRTLAERATWIGNDETHYIRKHEDLDVQDMKRFIRAMVAFIDAEFAFQDALKVEPKK